jgi:hypothetical protein
VVKGLESLNGSGNFTITMLLQLLGRKLNLGTHKLAPIFDIFEDPFCHGSDQIRHVALLVGHVTSLSVTLSERVLVSPKSCALLDFLSFLFSLEFLYLEQPLESQTSCASAVTILIIFSRQLESHQYQQHHQGSFQKLKHRNYGTNYVKGGRHLTISMLTLHLLPNLRFLRFGLLYQFRHPTTKLLPLPHLIRSLYSRN